LRRRLPDHLKERAVRVLVAVADRYGTTVEAILEKRRSGEGGPIAEAMWCLRWTGMSFPEVAIAVSRENHTTVISACARVERRFADHLSLRTELEAIARAAMVSDLPRRQVVVERPVFAPGAARPALRSVG
jgi:chromosomal replication initiation ATPase DnaA